jgi:hypothetical protein
MSCSPAPDHLLVTKYSVGEAPGVTVFVPYHPFGSG